MPKKTVSVHSRNKYTAVEIEHALLELAISNGNVQMAERRTGIGHHTIRAWRNKWPERYEEIKANLAPVVEAQIVAQARANARRAAEIAGGLLEEIEDAESADNAAKYAKAFQQVSIGQGVQIDKTLLLEGRPTEILEKRDTQQMLKELADVAPSLFVDSTAVDVSPQELPASAGS